VARILVVDDDEAVRDTLSGLLRLGEHDPIAPQSRNELEVTIRTGAYDLVITDLIMPDIDGLEVVKLVRDAKPGCPVVVISGGSPRVPGHLGLTLAGKLGADATLKKPFLKTELFAVIAPLLAEAD
jgi:DNA-binding response OmpR family regulator